MHDTTAPQTPARFRQWETVHHDEMDGVTVQVRRHTVALYRSRYTGEIMGLIDGNAVPLERAVSVILSADVVTKVYEELEQLPAAAPIGNQAARTLHVDLSRLGFRDHYATAADALGRPVASLADLTAAESATVRSYARGQWGMV